MTDLIRIEAAPEQRRDFARWCLAQVPRLEVSGAFTTDVPLELYASIPVELLEGAYVDGYLYGGPAVPQPVAAPADDPVEPPHPATVITETALAALENGATPEEALEAARAVETDIPKRVILAEETAPERAPRTRRRAGKANT